MRVIVTRPQRDAQDWVRDLTAAGISALALPLIEIRCAPDAAALQRAWQQMDAGQYAAVMFVSANAVLGFFEQKPVLSLSLGASSAIKTRAWTPGPGTARALLSAGVAPSRLDTPAKEAAQFDSEALWQVVGAQLRPGDRVLIVRGGDAPSASTQGRGRDWLAQRVAEAGASVDYVVAYQRACPQLDDAQLALARSAASDGSVWLFSSSEAVHNLQALLPGQGWGAARAIATHARIAAAVRQAGFAVVRESRPALADILASIESMR
jgi:uroporphyrinogen-III synthase